MGLVFQGILGQHDYTQLLRNADLSKVIFAYGTRDRRTGSLEEDEKLFLTERSAHVISVPSTTGNGGHDSMFLGDVPQEIVDKLSQ